MTEVEKMYENAGIKPLPTCNSCNMLDEYWSNGTYCSTCKYDKDKYECDIANYFYPPFTAEKQLEMIEWIIGKYNEVSFSKRGSGYNICIDDGSFIGCHHNDKAFERCLAGDINLLWQDLTEEERKQIKEILSE